jgi:hypothetical protein
MTKKRQGTILIVSGGILFLLCIVLNKSLAVFIPILMLCPMPMVIIGIILFLSEKRMPIDALKREARLAQDSTPKEAAQQPARSEPFEKASVPSCKPSPSTEQPVADYRLVKEQNGNIKGVWFRDPTKANNGAMLFMLLIKEGLSKDVQFAVSMGYYRIEPNTLDNTGGCFIIWDEFPDLGKKPPMPPISLLGGK